MRGAFELEPGAELGGGDVRIDTVDSCDHGELVCFGEKTERFNLQREGRGRGRGRSEREESAFQLKHVPT